MNVTSKSIITQISKKTGSSNSENTYDTYNIGAQLQYVSAIINSNSHNLEEQILIGTDADTTFVQTNMTEGDAEVQQPFIQEIWTTNFRIQGNNNSYYKLVTTRKRDYKINFNSSTGNFNLNLAPQVFKEKKELFYYGQNGNPTSVSVKTYTYTYSGSTVTIVEEISEPS